jgi:hypothetical protein
LRRAIGSGGDVECLERSFEHSAWIRACLGRLCRKDTGGLEQDAFAVKPACRYLI